MLLHLAAISLGAGKRCVIPQLIGGKVDGTCWGRLRNNPQCFDTAVARVRTRYSECLRNALRRIAEQFKMLRYGTCRVRIDKRRIPVQGAALTEGDAAQSFGRGRFHLERIPRVSLSCCDSRLVRGGNRQCACEPRPLLGEAAERAAE